MGYKDINCVKIEKKNPCYTVRSEHSSNEPDKQSNPWSADSTYTSDRHQTTKDAPCK